MNKITYFKNNITGEEWEEVEEETFTEEENRNAEEKREDDLWDLQNCN